MSETAAHPTPKLYWIIALILAVVTAIEVAIPSIPALDPIKVPALLILGAVKFAIVVAFFMHLKYDTALFRSLFLIGVFGSIPLFVVVLLTFNSL
ncbi:MAG TPA: cytochrome C oxidase subunit IV family protein [Acidimicrobiia bacterium]|jgi:cytochrome c oxidase subunit 4|nr:cytochrome C oxidase subunit IV family protein [Acidimicrobiia bacterium]